MDIDVTATPTDLVADQSLSSGDTLLLQAVSAKSAIFVARVTDQPVSTDKGMRLAYGMEPYAMEVLSDPSTMWVWAATGNSADLAYTITLAKRIVDNKELGTISVTTGDPILNSPTLAKVAAGNI